jgi:DNA topoisomerase-1
MLHYNFYFKGGGKKKWTELRHNGPMLAPLYEPHKIPIIFNNEKIILNPQAEEYATMYARLLGTKYLESSLFKKNFWKDFHPTINNSKINDLESIDFTLIKNYLDNLKEQKKNISKEEKEKEKLEKLKIEEPYMYCIIDGAQQKVGNYKIEPPGIFLGRGNHPKMGRIKKRIYPEDITINLDKNALIPSTPKDHKWGKIIHDQNVIWLCSWKENISDKMKYIFTSLDSFFKAKSDEEKFDLARKLKKKIQQIRENYEKDLLNKNEKIRQLATALYFIDILALRVGGKKDSKEEADTVGVTSLRLEHIQLLENNQIKLDFLGKDSVRYCKRINVLDSVYENIKEFIKDKKRKDQLFDKISANNINEYLDTFMKGLSAKVFRTYNASNFFQKEIDRISHSKKIKLFIDKTERTNYLISLFNQANTEVALLCNHQKNVDSNIEINIKKYTDRLKELKNKRKKYIEKKNKEKADNYNRKIKLLQIKIETKLKMKNVSLTTSKNNYIDPRIIFAFIKKYDVPREQILNDKSFKRFEWASIVDENYKF